VPPGFTGEAALPWLQEWRAPVGTFIDN